MWEQHTQFTESLHSKVKTPPKVLLLPTGILTLELKGLSLGKLTSS